MSERIYTLFSFVFMLFLVVAFVLVIIYLFDIAIEEGHKNVEEVEKPTCIKNCNILGMSFFRYEIESGWKGECWCIKDNIPIEVPI